jgi:hypothetical protein
MMSQAPSEDPIKLDAGSCHPTGHFGKNLLSDGSLPSQP